MILCFTIGTEKKILKDNQTFIAKPKSHMDTKKRFFDHLYHMFPFLDEFLFKDDISNIIGSESFDEHCINTLKVKKIDFARLGLLLIILRSRTIYILPTLGVK